MQCSHLKGNRQCKAHAMANSQFCFMHDPDIKAKRVEAARKGGSVTYERGLIALQPLDLTDPKMVLYLLADTINRARQVEPDGTMSIKRANCIASLAAKMIETQKLLRILQLYKEFIELRTYAIEQNT